MTHKFAEIRPSSRINFVLGHNGTGKSSIVCAICLCLGGEPSDMDRSQDLQGYIMHGATMASVTIELQGTGNKNITLTRVLKKILSSVKPKVQSTWKLDGEVRPAEDVKRMLRELNIRVGNNTQFLPQEKVGKFSEMKSTDLLRNTLQAISSEHFANYEDLGRMSKTQEGASTNMESLNLSIVETTNKKQKLAGGLKSWEAYGKIERELRLLETVQLLAARRDLLKKQAEEKESAPMEAETTELAVLAKEIPALGEELASSKVRVNEIELEFQTAKGHRTRVSKDLVTLQGQLEEGGDELETLYDAFSEMDKNSKKLEISLAKARKVEGLAKVELKRLEEKVEKFSKKEALDDLKSKASGLASSVQNKMDEVDEAQQVLNNLKKEVLKKRSLCEKEETARVARMRAIEGKSKFWYNDILKVETAAKRKGFFVDEVCISPVLTMALSNHSLAPMLEKACVTEFTKGVVCRNSKDANEVLKMTTSLNVSIISETEAAQALILAKGASATATKLAEDLDLKDLKCCLDYITTEDLAMALLVNKIEAHKKFVTTDPKTVEKLVAYSKANGDKNLLGYHFLFPTGQVSFMSHFSRSTFRPPEIFVHNVDPKKAALLRDELKKKEMEEDAALKALKDLEGSLRALRGELDSADKLLVEVKENQKKLKTQQLRYLGAVKMVKECEDELDSAGGGPEQKQRAVLELRKVQERVLIHAKNLTSLARDLATFEEAHASLSLQLKWENEVSRALNVKQAKLNKRKLELEKEIGCRADEARKLREQSEKCANEYVLAYTSLEKDDKTWLNDYVKQNPLKLSLDDISSECETKKAELALIQIDPETKKKYDQLVAKLEQLNAEKAEIQSSLSSAANTMAQRVAAFKNDVTSITSSMSQRFSSFMADLKNAGSVELNAPDSNVLNWGLEVKVSFRQNDEPSILSATRHSGGERAVSTMLVLLAMQDSTPMPFRLVDEINQGMDPMYERGVMQILARVFDAVDGEGRPLPGAKAQKKSVVSRQLFVVTPKLLPDLRHAPSMRTLVVFNGPEIVGQMEAHAYFTSFCDLVAAKSSRELMETVEDGIELVDDEVETEEEEEEEEELEVEGALGKRKSSGSRGDVGVKQPRH